MQKEKMFGVTCVFGATGMAQQCCVLCDKNNCLFLCDADECRRTVSWYFCLL